MDQSNAEAKEIERELGDRYQVVRLLGRGAFGAVYLARERQLHRLVAIKMLRAEHAWSEAERARLLQEARTVANLSHPAIVPLLAFGESATSVYMVMPYANGETLGERLAREGKLEPREARRILIEIADALAYAHGEGVLHRDIKPENILLERAGAVGDEEMPSRVRLLDFGVAAFPARDLGVGVEREGAGTVHYMSPEQALGERDLDARSDIFALGVLGYLMLTGTVPFEGPSTAAIIARISRGERVPLGVAAPDAPVDLVAAIDRCLYPNPSGRWRRAGELRDALVRGVETQPGAPAPLSLARHKLRARRRGRLSRRRRRRAAGGMGTPEMLAPEARGGRRLIPRSFSGIGADVRFAARTLRKTPGFTLAIILTLALGLGATTVVFSAVEALVLRPLPVTEPGRLVVLQERREGPNQSSDFGASTFRYDRYLGYRGAAAGVLSGLAAQSFESYSVRLGDQAHAVIGLATSGNYFGVLGVRPALGHFYTAREDEPGGIEPVAVMGYDFWQRALGGDSAVVGKTLFVDSRPLTIVGVAPRGFHGAFAGVFDFQLWVPAAAYQLQIGDSPSAPTHRPQYVWANLFGRLRPGVDAARASAALRVTGPRVPTPNAATRVLDVRAEQLGALPREIKRGADRFMIMLLAFAGLVLLIAATNAAGMLLARAATRTREVATRLAVGATRARLVRQLLVESVLLCVVAGAAGLLLTWWLTRLLSAWQPPFPIDVAVEFGLNGTVLAAAAATVLGTALLAGLVPAMQSTRMDLSAAMKEGGARAGQRRSRLRNLFVVAQVAFSVVLLTVAGLFVRSLRRTLSVDPGFQPAGVVRAGVNLGPHGYDLRRALALFHGLEARLSARPEVAAAAFAEAAPLSGGDEYWGVTRADRPDDEQLPAQWGAADVGLLELLRVPLRAGRAFTFADDSTAPKVAVINETMARRLWPGENPREVVGQRIVSLGRPMTVVGVMANGKYTTLQEDARAYAFVPFAQWIGWGPTIYVRARGSPSAALAATREELAALDPNVALEQPTLLTADIDRYLVPQRLGALLVGAFGLVGLFLAMTGLYGVLAYGVTQRWREFGVRVALGATSRQIVRLVVRQGLLLAAAGIVLGLAGAVLAGRMVADFLFGLNPRDPLTLVLVPAILILVALLATMLPARRAAAVDPMESLRAE